MLFCSRQYLLFFAAIFLTYWVLPWRRPRVWLLLGASFYFYASWNRWLAALVAASATAHYLIGRGLDASSSPRVRRLLMAFSVAANLGLLCYFKYANFFLRSLEDALRAAGTEASLPVLRVILPVGISFYTFEAINYTVDVYRRRAPAERDLAHFLLFILFFPHLVAGPIVRARDFLPQIRRPKRWDWLRLQLGAQYFLLGLVKKLAVADRMALLADPVFADPGAYGTGAVWLATLAYALQIYCDFSGYSDMALGSAHLLGYKLAQNFNMPYLSANVSEFWRRWHISLSSWLRDYLFIPLGGSRGSSCPRCCRLLTYRNLLLTMALGGLWHGASWTFVVWGLLHGLMLIAHRLFQAACRRLPLLERVLRTVPGTAGRVAVTFLCVALCWVFFRAGTLPDALAALGRLGRPSPGLPAPLPAFHLWVTVAGVALCHALAFGRAWKWLAARTPPALVGLGYGCACTAALLLAPATHKAFIYFQF